MIYWLTFISIVGFAIIFSLFIVLRNKEKERHKKSPFVFGKKHKNNTAKFNDFAQLSYARVSSIPILRNGLSRIRKRLETLSVYDEYTLRREVMRIAFSVLAAVTMIVLLLIAIRPPWLVVFWVLLGLVFIMNTIIDVFVSRVEVRLLRQMREYNNRLRSYFKKTKMVDEAVFESLQHVGLEMKVQAERIYKILASADPEKELSLYTEVAPSRFLKIIAGLVVQVKEHGDVVTDKRGSTFLNGLSSVNQELDIETLHRSRLSYSMRGVPILSVLPFFFALPLKHWATAKFPVMQSFYESRLGFLAEVLIYCVALACYFIARKMREMSESTYQARVKRLRWEEWILNKVPFSKKIVQAFSPASYSKEHFRITELLKETNSPLKIEWLTIHRLILTVAAFLIFIGGFWFAHVREKNSALYSSIPTSIYAGNLSNEDIEEYQKMTEFDRSVIESMQNVEITSKESLQNYITEQLGLEENDRTVKIAMDRILGKWQVVNNAYLKWWEVFIAILLAVSAWYLPIGILYFQRSLRRKDMENEVRQHLILIAVLRDFDRMSAYTLLIWMDRFSSVFKRQISESIEFYDAGPEKALDQLEERVSFEPFKQIVDRLRLSILRISIKEAFDDVEIEREYYQEQRRESNHRSILEKTNLAYGLGLAPLLVLILLYVVGPLTFISISESVKLFSQLK